MTIQTSGEISITDLVSEFGGTAPHAIQEYYKGGSIVDDNSGTTNVPASGEISLTDFYGAYKCTTIAITTQLLSTAQTITLAGEGECEKSVFLQISGGGGGGQGFNFTGPDRDDVPSPGGAGGTTTVVHKRGATTVNTYTATGGGATAAGSCIRQGVVQYVVSNNFVRCGSLAASNGSSFSQTGMTGSGGGRGSKGAITGPNLGNGGDGSGCSSGGGGGVTTGRGDPFWDSDRAGAAGGNVGNYTTVTLSVQAGDTLEVVTIGVGGSGGGVVKNDGERATTRGGNGSAGCVRVSQV